MKFAKRGDRTRVQQTFDAKNQYITKAGRKINQYRMIQEASEDTDIYKTLEKYGSLERMTVNHEGVYAEFNDVMDLRDLHEQQKRAKDLWESLPLELRNQFHNDRVEFMQNGKNWLEEQIKKTKPETKPAETKTEVKNEQKQ